MRRFFYESYGMYENYLGDIQKNLERDRFFFTSFRLIKHVQYLPIWMKKNDLLFPLVEKQKSLLSKGRVGWAALVQANRILFSQGDDDHPAQLVYSTDSYFNKCPDELANLATQLYQLKNTTPSEASLKEIAELITGELIRDFQWRLPRKMSEREVFSSTFMVYRQHLPSQVLVGQIFPVVYDESGFVMIVPSHYWPIELVTLIGAA